MPELITQRLERLCSEAEETYKKLGIPNPGIQVKLYRRCKGKTARIFPGLSGKVVFWGDRANPSIVFLKCSDIRKFLERLKCKQHQAKEGGKK